MGKIDLTVREKKSSDYGANLYVIKVPQKIAKELEITAWADGFSIEDGGVLTLWCVDGEDITNTFSLQRENWVYCYKANIPGEQPSCVQRWNGVANIRTVEKEPVKEVIQEEKPEEVKEVIQEPEEVKEVIQEPEEQQPSQNP